MLEKFETQLTKGVDKEKLIESKPKLKNIFKTINLLDGYTDWKNDLPQKIGEWENSLDLFGKIQKAVQDQAREKILMFRDKVSSLSKIPDENILDILVNNWPEETPEIQGQRREVLLNVAAHVIRRMETKAYQAILENADNNQLKRLGLNSESRNIAIKALDACMKSDVLFIRYLAFVNLARTTPKEATASHFYLPHDNKPYTINSLFPRETGYIAKKFEEISKMPLNWEKIPGGNIFKEYVDALSMAYKEKDVNKIDDRYKKVDELFQQSASSDFPILIIPPEYTSGYTKQPYHDPELKVCLKAPECREIEKNLYKSQKIMAECLEENGRQDSSQSLSKKKIRVVNSIGDYGVSLNCKAFAQVTGSMIIVLLSEQIKAQKEMAKNKNFKLKNLEEQEGKKILFYSIPLHEFGHLHNDEKNPEVKRLGRKWSITIGEAEAETLYRSLIPQMIRKNGIEGTEEQWAAALVENSLEELKDKSAEADPAYYYSAVYTLNKIFAEGAAEFDFKNGDVSIKDVAAFYKIQKALAEAVTTLYKDESMNERKTDRWVKENCMPNEIVKKISDFIKKGA